MLMAQDDDDDDIYRVTKKKKKNKTHLVLTEIHEFNSGLFFFFRI